MSVGLHLALSSSNGLFHKAIMESGMAEGYPTLDVSNTLMKISLIIKLIQEYIESNTCW